MFRAPIILIDDKEDHLDELSKAFALSGLPCLPILYDSENESGIDHIVSHSDTAHARIIALDINLREHHDPTDEKVLYPPIEKILEKLNPTGPYFILFWSRYKELPEKIMELLAERSQEVVPAPIGWDFLDKTEFHAIEDPNAKKHKLLELVGKVKIFNLLLEWENRTGLAASFTLSELNKIAGSSNGNGWDIDNTIKKLTTLLTHIAHESVGRLNSKENPNQAVEAGLLPILDDKLLVMTEDLDIDELNTKWQECLEKIGERAGLDELSGEETSSLNTFYNLEEIPETFPKTMRGVFVQASDRLKADADFFTSVFGTGNSIKKLISEEFLFNTSVRDKTFRDSARDSLLLGFLEIGAVCDHAQMKNRLHKYLFSALVPLEYLEMVSRDKKDRAHGGIYRSPVLSYKENQYVLLVSYRYSTGLHENSDILDKPLFRLKEQIVNEISFSWSKHSIRPGITSFDNG